MRTIEFQGHAIEYDETCIKSWKWQKALASGNDAKGIAAIERLFMGKDEEVADLIGDDLDTMGKLIAAISAENRTAKN